MVRSLALTALGLFISLTVLASSPAKAAEMKQVEYLDEITDRLLSMRQDWGQLGINTCAHLPQVKGIPLQIGETKYKRGLGHHANGEIVVDLNGEYARFEALVGVQWLDEAKGSVVFKVLVDGKERFNSGEMTRDTAPKEINIPVDGALELELIAIDADDGITCDCADWVDARLTRNTTGTAAKRPVLDIAPFARIVTSDPARMDGAHAGRIDEYHKEDIYLEVDAGKDADGNYELFKAADGRQCIGLTWIERRHVRELSVEFERGSGPKNTEGARVEYWTGGTPYQGRWVALDATIEADGDRWTCVIDRGKNEDLMRGTWKFRWVFPSAEKPLKIRGLHATSMSRCYQLGVRVEVDPAREYALNVYNGRIIDEIRGRASTFKVIGTRSRPWQPEHTTLLFQFEDGAFGVSLDDVIANDAAYVKDFGLLVSREDAHLTLADYRKSISGRKTILEEVRELPDQTFEKALEVIHNPSQDMQPTMLSLSCDNRKFIVERSGTVSFSSEYDKSGGFVSGLQLLPCRLVPTFGSGNSKDITRHLDGGWLPAPVTEVRENGAVYRQRTFVTPAPGAMFANEADRKAYAGSSGLRRPVHHHE